VLERLAKALGLNASATAAALAEVATALAD